jgi:REP element-mobilizing transposase RayT
MPSTHSSLIFHVVFSTKEREVWFPPDFRPRLHAYLGGIIRNSGGIAYAVGGTGDHVHLLIGLKPTDVIPDLLRVVKAESSKWIKGELNQTAFAWQDGYGVFSVSASGARIIGTLSPGVAPPATFGASLPGLRKQALPPQAAFPLPLPRAGGAAARAA